MNRKIKFRAWEPDTEKMLDVFGLNPMVSTAYVSHVQMFGNEGDDLCLSYAESDEYSYLRLMQFTGMEDNDGKSIYEGDIISDGLFAMEVTYGLTGFLAGGEELWSYDGEPYRVIGNIYQGTDSNYKPLKENR